MRLRCAALALLLVGLASAGWCRADAALDAVRAGQDAFDRAVALWRDDPSAALREYQAAVAAWQPLAEQGVGGTALQYNLGNAYFRAGDVGRAILAYRRALRDAPTDERIRANLDYARRRVTPFVEPAEGVRLWRRVLYLHEFAAPRQRFAWAVGLAWLGALALAARWRYRTAALGWGGGAALLVALTLAVSLVVQLREEAATPEAVLIGPAQTLRSGRGEAHEAVVKQPLGAGMELRIVQTRGEWAEVELRDGVRGWLPRAALEAVAGG